MTSSPDQCDADSVVYCEKKNILFIYVTRYCIYFIYCNNYHNKLLFLLCTTVLVVDL